MTTQQINEIIAKRLGSMTENIKVEVDAGDETGKVSLEMEHSANVSEWLETFERILLFLGYHPQSIKDAFADVGEKK